MPSPQIGMQLLLEMPYPAVQESQETVIAGVSEQATQPGMTEQFAAQA
jgi:hypothetical protein